MNIKRVLFCFLIFYTSQNVFAQKQPDNGNDKKTILNIGIESQLPIKDFKTFYSYGLGATLIGEYRIFKNFKLALEPGYTRYFFDKSTGVSGSTGFFTVVGGPKYILPYNIYLTAKAGLGVKLLKEEKESGLALSGGVGIYVTKKLDAQLKYLKINTATTAPRVICLRIGYNFL